jgi:ribosomal protein S18 acetylase RimI-like enzyme
MPVVYRPARVEDLERADALVVASINDLTEGHGFGPMAVSSPPNFQYFSLKDDAEGLWVAEDGDKMLGFAWSWVCEGLWFLAQLFVLPSHQGRNIGNELIRRTLEHARKSGATNKVLITFAFNTVSQGLYIRHGFFPRFPIYSFGVARERVIGRLESALLRCEPLEESTSTLQRLADVDARVLGVSRKKHHRYLLNDPATKGFGLYAGDEWMGYVYVDALGHIGPLAVIKPDAVSAAFKTALHLAAGGPSSKISAFLPGASQAALNTAVEHGMRIRFPMLLMSSHKFGDWAQYLPRNPGFM